MRRILMLLGLGLAGVARAAAPDPGWSDAERWAWERIAAREIADFHDRPDCSGRLDPRDATAEGWSDPCRQLGPRFFAQVLTAEPWRTATPFQGVRIAGARITERLDLAAARIDAEVWLNASRIEAPFTIDRVSAARLLDFSGSTFTAGLRADSLSSKSSLYLRNGVVAGGIFRLSGATFDGQVSLNGSNFEQGIVAFTLRVGQAFFLDDATVGAPPSSSGADEGMSLDLLAAQIGGQVSLDRSHFDRGIDADAIKLKDGFFLRNAAVSAAPLVLRGAEIEGMISFEGSRLDGGIAGDSLRVAKFAAMRKAVFGAPLELTAARFGDNVQFGGSELMGVDLRGATITGELRLADQWSGPPRWGDDAVLTLRNARIGALEDASHGATAWPPIIRFQGLMYDRLGGIGQDSGVGMLRRAPEWYAGWLQRDPDFSRQPYQHLAGVLRAAGDPNLADEVLVTAGLREMDVIWANIPWSAGPLAVLSPEFRDWVVRYIAWVTIGFGIGDGYQRVLWWVLGLTLVGSLVLRCAPAARAKGVWWRLGASLDHLLPIIELNPEFGKFFNDPKRVRLRGWQIAYFALHALTGYVFGVVIAAGLGGLTQPG